MKYVYLLLSAILLSVWVAFGNYPGPAGLPVPALGRFFSPTEGFWRNTPPAASARAGERELSIDHPLATGDVFFDGRGVPHIFAPDVASASFLQGYLHAADRMWQMDVSTRATEGRLSEVLGDRMLARDRTQIRRGFRYAARAEADTIAAHFPEELAALEAYAAGFNAYADQLAPEDYPVEYKLLDHAPIRWSPYRTALLMKGMSQSLSGRYNDAAADKTRSELGPERFEALFPGRFPGDSPIVPDDGRYKNKGKVAQRGPEPPVAPASPPLSFLNDPEPPADVTQPYTLMPPHPGNGSNNWAVSGARSNTGHPLLASDPHLALTLPSIWYEAQIVLPGVNARGVGLPGAPGIIIGFNDHVAYGETNVGHDVTDWFRITWTDTTRTTYLLDGQPTAARIAVDTLFVKGADPIIVRTPWTVFGPVPYTEGPYADHAMRYLAHDAPGADKRPGTLAGTFLGLTKARTYDDYLDALRGYIDPAQNFVYANKNGDIAIRPNGGFPLRGGYSGRFTAPGDRGANNWRGYVPFGERPEHKNPARGYVSSANQTTTGPNYPYPYVGGFDEYRGRFINRRLGKERTMNQRKMKELQLDSHSLLAEELTPILIARINRGALTDEGRKLLRLISEWDYNFTGESRAATAFEQWRAKVYELTFDEFPRDSGYLRPEVWKWNNLLREAPTDKVFDVIATTDFRETASTLTQRAFDEILEALDGGEPAAWYEHRNTHVRHLGAIPGFGSELITTAGVSSSPRALSSGHGASWRMVVELGPEPRAWGTLPGGASGNPASPFYDVNLDDWANGRYHELTRWRNVEEAADKAVGHWRFR